MKTILLFLLVFLGVNSSYAQDALDIQLWQLAHPNILFISADNYASFDESTRNELFGKVIIFEESIRWKDIVAFDSSVKSAETGVINTGKESDLAYVKIWLANHPDVKIIRRSEYVSASQDDQQSYLANEALILKGEVVTFEDISNY